MTATLPPSLSRHPLASLAMGADLNGALSTTSCDGETTAVTRERRHGVFTPHALLIKRPVGVRLLSPYALLITRLVGVRRRRRRRRRGRVVARTIAPIWEQLNILKRIRQAGITALKSFAEALRPILAISRVRCRLGGRSGLRPESRLPGLLLAVCSRGTRLQATRGARGTRVGRGARGARVGYGHRGASRATFARVT